eukprot:TRINITY_DN8008_c0_g1_i1.p1 TRINITY_DN8008_c0_g1~~TRINITY_DN8008_c0_g1_i1.p1  ORF type:complete len:457 (-),score=49.18 TRINITY_DN8008_c0_g1_i1:345-1715(-)
MSKWNHVSIKGSVVPLERHGHTTCSYNNKVILFGGTPDGSSGLSDLHIFDVDTNQWSVPEVRGNLPSGRYRHSAVVIKNCMYVFGGYRSKCLDDLHILDLHTMTWFQPEVRGNLPSARSSHSVVVYGKKMVLFGGSGHKYSNDVYTFDTETYTWEKEGTTGTIPSERWCHTACAFGKNMYVLGGSNDKRKDNKVYILNMETMEWTTPNVAGVAPSPRQLHTCVAIGETMIIFGGWILHQELNDLYTFNIRTNTWTKPQFDGKPPSYRQLHSACMANGSMYVFGGYSKYRRMNDIHTFTPERTTCSLRELCIEKLVENHTNTNASLYLLAEEITEDYFKRLGQVGKLSIREFEVFLRSACIVTELGLGVAGESVTDDWLDTLSKCGNVYNSLIRLDLVGCKSVGQRGLKFLSPIQSLRLVVLDPECSLFPHEIDELKELMPNVLFMKALPLLPEQKS